MDIKSVLEALSLTPTDAKMILVGMALFVIFWRILDRVLFAPMLKLISAREEAIVGAVKRAQELQERAQELLAKRDEELSRFRGEEMAKRAEALAVASAKASSIIERAQREAERFIKNKRQELSAQVKQERERLLNEVDSLAELAASRLEAEVAN